MGDVLKVSYLYINRIPTLLCSNYNVPPANFDPETYKKVLDNIKRDYIFNNNDVYFAISANCILEHEVTLEERRFGGSFHAKGIYQNLILPFQPVRDERFTNILSQQINEVEITNKLKQLYPDSVWKFKRLVSIIINVQGSASMLRHSYEHVFV